MKELSVFIDESGDFGEYSPHSPYYIITMVFHNQDTSINEALDHDVKIYYDNGQVEVNKILSSVFHAMLPTVEFRKVTPSQYKLFQAADLFCTMHLLQLKLNSNQLSKSECAFFGNIRDLRKNYLKPLSKKEWI